MPFSLLPVKFTRVRPTIFLKVAGMLPWNEFSSILMASMTLRLPMVSGISHDNLFPDSKSCPRFTNLPIPEGTGPSSMLYDKSSPIESDDSSIILFGIKPVSLLPPKPRKLICFQFPILDGIGPAKLLSFALRNDPVEQVA
ncbi:unnamed protein product [Urochloa humidicola]